jgi:hypothetical protein
MTNETQMTNDEKIGEGTRLACWRGRPGGRRPAPLDNIAGLCGQRAFRRGHRNAHAGARALPSASNFVIRVSSFVRHSSFAIRHFC